MRGKMTEKLTGPQKHLLCLIDKDANCDGWSDVSEVVYCHVLDIVTFDLAIFERTESGGRARLTDEGACIIKAMKWL